MIIKLSHPCTNLPKQGALEQLVSISSSAVDFVYSLLLTHPRQQKAQKTVRLHIVMNRVTNMMSESV